MEKELKVLCELPCAIIFFISPKKLNKLIFPLKKYFNNRKIIFCRELTKYYEEFIRLEVNDLETFDNSPKGEMTVLISGNSDEKKRREIIPESVKVSIKKLINKLSVRDITDIFSDQTSISKSIIYKYCISIKNES